jgi:MerR family transcriptional regulator, light-induced transcriptional regulator
MEDPAPSDRLPPGPTAAAVPRHRRRPPLKRVDPAGAGLLSIGDLAAEAGISTDTLRAWERRYGRPEPVRLPSGHRRYRASDVPWLRRVAEALARGHRAGAVVALAPGALESLLSGGDGHGKPSREVAALLASLRGMRGEALDRALRRDAERLGPREFLRARVTPLLEAVGRAWADGRLEVRHEHYVAEVVEDRLRDLRTGVALPADAPPVVLSTLPGELHGLGLQMAALTCALRGVRPHVLGVDTPLPDIAGAAAHLRARAVLVSVSLATGGVATDRLLAALRGALPPRLPLVVGGAGARGARRGPRGVEFVEDLDGLEKRLGALFPA